MTVKNKQYIRSEIKQQAKVEFPERKFKNFFQKNLDAWLKEEKNKTTKQHMTDKQLNNQLLELILMGAETVWIAFSERDKKILVDLQKALEYEFLSNVETQDEIKRAVSRIRRGILK